MDPRNVDSLDLFELTSSTDEAAAWTGGWFAYGGDGAAKSGAIYFSIPAGKRLGRHVDTTEETQLIFSGSGDLIRDSGTKPVRAGDVVVLAEGEAHDLLNTGAEDLRVIAFFAAPQVEQHWTTDVWEPGNLKITGSPNR